jgi:exopolyphosphatase/guanosine-5'-triphosphate,3'-diphosphate pyrophosphatase
MESEDDRGAAAPAAPLTSPAADAAPGGMPECAQSLAAPIPTVTSTPFPAAARTAQDSTTTAPRSHSRPWLSDRNGDRGNDRNGTAPAYGALDLGTNNCRLLVARPSRRGFMVVDAFSRIIRLGEGVSTTGRLSDAAMHRTIEALKICESKLRKSGVVRSRLIATQACRVAANGEEFLERVRRDVGLEIEVVCRETEARLAVSGCAALIDGHCDLVLVFDIGGGSSELIWLDLNRSRSGWRRSMADRIEAQHCIAAWTSLPVGVVTIAERFGGRHVDAEAFEAMVDYVSGLLEPFETEHGFRSRMHNRRVHLLGTSGTVTTVAGIHLRLPRYDRNRVDGCWLKADQVRQVTSDLLARDYEARVSEPCIGRDRADLVLAGCAILEALMRTWPCETLRVADRGLREGILATLMAEDNVFRPSRRDSWQ